MEIYNLNFGNSKPAKPFSEAHIGPFKITVKDDYDIIQNQLPRAALVVANIFGEGNEFIQGINGGWIATADCLCVGPSEKSILSLKSIDDSGIWDLCQILSFLNGRNITCDPHDFRNNPNVFGDRACVDVEILHAAQIMWGKRSLLVDRKLVYSLLLLNSAIKCHDVNSQAGVISAAFNGIYDDWFREYKIQQSNPVKKSEAPLTQLTDLTKDEKVLTKNAVTRAIVDIEQLNEEKKDALINLIKGKIDGGLLSPVNLIQAMLISENIIPQVPAKDVTDRIKFMNAVRNKFVHNGSPPEFKKNRELSVEFSIFIICRLIPDLIKMYLGRVVGFTTGSVGSLSQHKHDFIQYFNHGLYGGRRVESESWHDEVSALIERQNSL